MLIGTRFGETPQLHLVKFPGGARTQLTFYPERVGGGSFNPKMGDHLVFSKDIGGNEFFQFYRFDVATGDATLLTDGKSRNTGWNWSNAGDRAIYNSTRRNGQDTDFYVIEPQNPEGTRLLMEVKGGGWFANADWRAVSLASRSESCASRAASKPEPTWPAYLSSPRCQ